MEYRFLGASGLEVSVLSFGTMTLGGEGRFAAMGNVQAEEARRLVEICIEAGVNLFDTADIYSLGKSEEVLGQARGAHRKDIVLATKAFVGLEPGTNKAGQLSVGSTTFQIGANVGETASLSLGNFAATELGTGVVAGKSLDNIDITSAANAADAMKVIDAAISGVSEKRGDIGSFQANVLQSNIRSLGVAKVNLSATMSSITDTDIAAEMTNFSKLQILQQAGMSMLSQANTSPQSVLSLIRGS